MQNKQSWATTFLRPQVISFLLVVGFSKPVSLYFLKVLESFFSTNCHRVPCFIRQSAARRRRTAQQMSRLIPPRPLSKSIQSCPVCFSLEALTMVLGG